MHATLRALAANDIDAALAHYHNVADDHVALNFIDALEAAIDHLRQHPHTGSLQLGYELDIPELRSWPVRKFPYLIFCVPDDDRIDIWRILHTKRDIPAHLAPDQPG